MKACCLFAAIHDHNTQSVSPALLALTSILGTLASRVASILDASGDTLKTVTHSLSAGGVVDGLADTTTSCAHKTASSLSDTAYSIADLYSCQIESSIDQMVR